MLFPLWEHLSCRVSFADVEPSARCQSRTVLVVEDQAVLARLTSLFLGRYGFDVVRASCYEEALTAISGNRQIDLILMDIDLGPGVNGLEVARRLGADCAIPILFHSSSGSQEVIAAARQVSRYGFVQKSGRHFVLLGPVVDLALSAHHVYELYSLTSGFRENRERYGDRSLVVCALCDSDLRYTWINDPHPDFVLRNAIGRTDVEIVANEGTRQLYDLKREVLASGRKARRDIAFPLSTGTVKYHVTAAPMLDKDACILGVKTLSFVV